MAASASAVLTSFLINGGVCLGILLFFGFFRVQPWSRRFFSPRRYAKDIDLKPKRLGNFVTAWIWPCITYPEEDIIDEVGLDAAMYLRLLRFGCVLFSIISVWCLVAILPVNLTSDYISTVINTQGNGTSVNGHDLKFTGFDRFSLSNVEPKSAKMWVHLISVYFVSITVIVLMWRFNKQSVLLRLMFLGNSARGGPTHTVLLTDIPGISDSVAEYRKQRAAERKAAKLAKKRALVATDTGCQTEVKGLDAPYVDIELQDSAVGTSTVIITQDKEKGKGGKGKGGKPSALANGNKEAPPPLPISTSGSLRTPLARGDSLVTGGGSGTTTPRTARSAQSSTQKKLPLSLSFLKKKYDDLEEPPPLTYDDIKTGLLEAEHQAEEEQIEVHIRLDVGMDTRPTVLTRRDTKRFRYNLDDVTLNPKVVAAKKLLSGMSPMAMIEQELKQVYPRNQIAAINLICDTAELEPLVAEFDKIQQKLEDYLDMAAYRLRLRKGMKHEKVTVLGLMYGEWGKKRGYRKGFQKVDALDHWVARLRFLHDEIARLQPICRELMSPSAFITFNTRAAQAIGATALHSHDVNAWKMRSAPAPFEVIWGNLSMIAPIRATRENVMWVLFWAMALFFMIPVSFIQALIEVPKLESVPVLGDIVTAPFIKQVLQSIIPGLVLKLFLIIVPIILAIMVRQSGATSENEIDFGVTKRYYLFQIVVVFFGNIIAGSFFNQIQAWVKDPSGIINTLGTAIPMTATFFITYVMVNGLSVKPIAAVRLPGFVIYWLLSKFAGSPRARTRLWSQQFVDIGVVVTDHMIAMLIGLVFSCINPIVCPVCLAYFLVSLCCESYNHIYVFRRKYESGGRMWQMTYNQVMIAMYIMQLTMFGLLAIKKFKYVPFLIPLILFTVGTHWTTTVMYSRPWSVTALHDAADLDLYEADQRRRRLLAAAEEERKNAKIALLRASKDGNIPPIPYGPAYEKLMDAMATEVLLVEESEKKVLRELYKSPAFMVDLSAVERLATEAKDIRGRIDLLNEWLEAIKKLREKPAKEGKGSDAGSDAGDGKPALPVPAAITKFDDKPEPDADTRSEDGDRPMQPGDEESDMRRGASVVA